MPNPWRLSVTLATVLLLMVAVALSASTKWHRMSHSDAADGPKWQPTTASLRAIRRLHQVPAVSSDAASNTSSSLDPGSMVAAFQVATLDGTFTYTPSTNSSAAPLIFVAFDSNNAFLDAMWTHDQYVDALLLHSPTDAVYVFASYANKPASLARNEVYAMKKRLLARMKALDFSHIEQKQWLARLHFVVTPIQYLDNWIADLLAQWSMSLPQIVITGIDTSNTTAVWCTERERENSALLCACSDLMFDIPTRRPARGD
jgi:sulfur transfer complex TusBCD TusB component (DsrH family)